MQRPTIIKDRTYYEARYKSARIWLIIAVAITVLNILLTILGSDTVFLFCAIGPVNLISYALLGFQEPVALQALAAYLGFELPHESMATAVAVTLVAVAVLGILAYFFSWLCSKKDGRWMTVALVLFILDCLFMIADIALGVRMAKDFEYTYTPNIFAVVFHCWVVYDTVIGVTSWKKLKTMPEEVVEGTCEESAGASDAEASAPAELSEPVEVSAESSAPSPLAAAAATAAEEKPEDDEDDEDEDDDEGDF